MFCRYLKSLVLAGLAAGSASAGTPWEDYLANPSPQQALKVQVRSYSGGGDGGTNFERDLSLLETQVLAGDNEAVRLAFRLRPTSDGRAAEMLDVMLGRLIRNHPKLFLRELKRAGGADIALGSVVASFGEEFVDRTAARAYEAQQRIDALQQVKDERLVALRDQCIAVLKSKVGA